MKIGPLDSKAAVPAAIPARAVATEAGTRLPLSPDALPARERRGEFDATKVRQVSAALREGRYAVDPYAIADKLIGNAQDLLGRASN